MFKVTRDHDAIRFQVRVAPRAKRNRIGAAHDGKLKVSLTAPPVDGAANDALIKLLARALGVPKRNVTIVAGLTSKTKTVRVSEVDVTRVEALVQFEG